MNIEQFFPHVYTTSNISLCFEFKELILSFNSSSVTIVVANVAGGKSFALQCMYQALTKILSRKGDNSKPKVMLMAPTGVAAINIGGTTLHTGLGIPCNNFHPLSDKQRTTLRMKLENVKAIFIDEISMASSKLLLQVRQRLCEIF